jgi:hypothetical protein
MSNGAQEAISHTSDPDSHLQALFRMCPRSQSLLGLARLRLPEDVLLLLKQCQQPTSIPMTSSSIPPRHVPVCCLSGPAASGASTPSIDTNTTPT